MTRIEFDPYLECEYLARLDSQLRSATLQREIETAVAEKVGVVKFNEVYMWKEGSIFDPKSGEMLMTVAQRGPVEEETRAMERIEKMMAAEGKLVVVFSPENEELGYEDNVIDFWQRRGQEVTWRRVVVDSSWQEMEEYYQELGGRSVIGSKRDLLASPIEAKGFTMGGLLAWMETKKAAGRADDFMFGHVVEGLMAEFASEFGEKLYQDSKLIFRLFSAALAETEKRMEAGGIIFDDGWLPRARIDRYLHAPMITRMEKSFGCAGTAMVGKFVSEGRGMVVEMVAGKAVVRVGSIEGKKLCDKCGCYYSGSKCPLCK